MSIAALRRARGSACALLLCLAACQQPALRTSPATAPVAASAPATAPVSPSTGAKAAATPSSAASARVMVAAANPHAVDAGLAVLRAGGSAADAAVAVQAVLGLVEPQSSGLGGGGFITYYDAASKQVIAYDGRENAPAGATPDMFLGPDGQPLPFFTAVLSGRSTGVPGAVAALAQLQCEHGQLPWRDLFADAERLATAGFVITPRLAGMIHGRAPQAATPDARRYFTRADGHLYEAGDILKNPAYAATLRELAAQGPAALYSGRIARDIVARTHAGALPGTLSLQDLQDYRVRESAALCRPWRVYILCVPPPPSGGSALLQGMLLLEHTDIATRNADDPVAWVEFAEAQRLIYADRDRYIGDPQFIHVPLAGLLDPAYVAARARRIGVQAAATPPPAGTPPGAPARGADHTIEPGGTSEFVIVDAAGNVVSMTTTVESIFGSGRMVDGFFLNNQLTDFSFAPRTRTGAAAANAVAPRKQPRSAMTPVIVLDAQHHFAAAAGSSGGPAIIAYVMKTLIGVFDWHLSMQAAIDLPNLVASGRRFSAETTRMPPQLVIALNAHGVPVRPGQQEESGLQGIVVRPGGILEGGADSRREGVARGY